MISLNSINRLVLTMATQHVSCEVGTECLYIVYVTSMFKGKINLLVVVSE
jgi:hypothetical protein